MRWAFEHMQQPRGRLGLSAPVDPQPAAAGAHAVGRAGRPTSWPAATGMPPPEPGADIAIVCHGRRHARGDRRARERARATSPAPACCVLTSPDRLHADWLAASAIAAAPRARRSRAGPVERLLAPLSRDARLVTVLDGHPLALSLAGRGARPARRAAGHRGLRPVRRHPRPLSRLQARCGGDHRRGGAVRSTSCRTAGLQARSRRHHEAGLEARGPASLIA